MVLYGGSSSWRRGSPASVGAICNPWLRDDQAGPRRSDDGWLITWRVAYDMRNTLHVPPILGFTAHTVLAIRRAFARGTQRTRTAGGFAIVAIVALLAYLLTMSLS